MHHASIRTANIHRAIAFYETLGFQVTERFTTGLTLACWMEGLGGRVEFIQIPQPRPTVDAFGDEHYTGFYHLSFDLTETLTQQNQSLLDWVQHWSDRVTLHCQTSNSVLEPLRILLPPQQQQIGDKVYEVTFIADSDGLPLEFIKECPPADPK